MWTPETARIKSKMLYASSKDTLKISLDGISLEVQATDISEVEYEAINDAVRQTLTRK